MEIKVCTQALWTVGYLVLDMVQFTISIGLPIFEPCVFASLEDCLWNCH